MKCVWDFEGTCAMLFFIKKYNLVQEMRKIHSIWLVQHLNFSGKYHSSYNLILINITIYSTTIRFGISINWYCRDKPQLFPEKFNTCSSDLTNAFHHNLFGINNLLYLMRLLTCRKLDKSLCLQRTISCQDKEGKQQTQCREMIILAQKNRSWILFTSL